MAASWHAQTHQALLSTKHDDISHHKEQICRLQSRGGSAALPQGRLHLHAGWPKGWERRRAPFLSWELPIEDAHVARALGVVFDGEPPIARST